MSQTGWTRVTIFLPNNNPDETRSANDSLAYLAREFQFVTYSEMLRVSTPANRNASKFIVTNIEEELSQSDPSFVLKMIDTHIDLQSIYEKHNARQEEIKITSSDITRQSFTKQEIYGKIRSWPVKRV